MGNRILKESICSSDTIDRLTAFEETVFYRLVVNVDDYGRIDARPAFLKSKLFVTKQGITEKNVQDAVAKMACIGLVRLYEVDGKPFLCLPTWHLHQRVRDSKEKYPAPQSFAENRGELPQVAASGGLYPIQSESESNTNDCAEQAPAPPVITLTLNDKTEYPVTQEKVTEWAVLYPAVDVMQQLRNMRGWLTDNPSRRKTKTGILRFANAWLAREQDKGRASPKETPSEYAGLF